MPKLLFSESNTTRKEARRLVMDWLKDPCCDLDDLFDGEALRMVRRWLGARTRRDKARAIANAAQRTALLARDEADVAESIEKDTLNEFLEIFEATEA